MKKLARFPRPRRADRARLKPAGFSLVEILMVFAILSIVAAIAMPRYQQYTYRAQAAALALQAAPIRLAIQERYNTIDVSKYRLELSNAADGSIAGCAAPPGGGCIGPSETVVTADKLLLADGTVRVLAGLCQVDCPSYALSFTSGTEPAVGGSPPAGGSAPSTPGGDPSGQGKGAGKGKGGGKGASYFPLIASAYAQSLAPGVGATNRVLYEFGELMRPRVNASNNAECLQATGTCTVTLKYP